MKSDSVRTTLSTAFLSWLLSFATAGCLATAFGLPLHNGAGRLALLCGIFALVLAFAFRHFHTAIPITLLLGTQLFLLYSLQQKPLQMHFLLPHITEFFHRAYGWPVLLKNSITAAQADLALLRLTLVICFFLCWALSRRKNLVLCLLPLSPLACCVVVYDTVPDAKYLAALLFGLLLMLFTHRLRRQEATGDWSRQGVKLMPATALLLALLLLAAPQSNGLNPLRLAADKLLPWIENLMIPTPGNGSGNIVGPSTAIGINLSTLGPKTQSDTVVLHVTSSKGGLTYLRHKSMMHYTGTAWHTIRDRTEPFGTETRWPAEQITITTVLPLSYLYAPYFPDKQLTFVEGILVNKSRKTTYNYALSETFKPKEEHIPSASIYTDLPDATKTWATDLVEDLLQGVSSTEEKVKRIGEYVQNSAAYSLNTPSMPSYSTDFAKWFLERSDTGYCVHFATAATVLLRAAGIPAMYIEGMTVQTSAGEKTPVTNANAHAWVEYFDLETSQWEILDATPADGIPDDPPVVNPDDPDDPDNPDDPDDPDTPDNPDDPDDPDNPDNPDDPDNPDEPAQPDTPNLPSMTPDDYPPAVRLGRLLGTIAGAVILLLIAQALLRRRAHRRNWNQGEANSQGLERYRQCSLLAKVCKLTLPEELTELAGKARFSQHQLTEEELAQFDDFMQKALSAAKAEPLHRKLLRFFVAAL